MQKIRWRYFPQSATGLTKKLIGLKHSNFFPALLLSGPLRDEARYKPIYHADRYFATRFRDLLRGCCNNRPTASVCGFVTFVCFHSDFRAMRRQSAQ